MYPRVFYFILFFFVALNLIRFLFRVTNWNFLAGARKTIAALLLSAILMAIPIDGIPVVDYLKGFNANWSIPSFFFLLDGLYANLSGKRSLLDSRARHTMWLFGSIAALLLYPSSLGLFTFDTYEYGFGSPYLLVPLAAVTLALLLTGNYFTVILLACVLAWNIGLQESRNIWDYLVDPFYGIISIFAALRATARFLLKTGHREIGQEE